MTHNGEKLGFVEYAYAATSTLLQSHSSRVIVKVPDTLREAMKLREAVLWKEGAVREIKGLQELKAYTLVPHSDGPQGQHVIGSR